TEISSAALEEAVLMLSTERATKYGSWWYVGYLLRHLRPEDDGEFATLFHAFSAKCPSKYDYDEVKEYCEERFKVEEQQWDCDESSFLLKFLKMLRKDAGEEEM